MTLPLTNNLSSFIGRLRSASWRWAGLSLLVIGFVLFSRSSLAEFEVPLIDTNNSLDKVEFRNVWAYNRGIQVDSATKWEGYEAYAVGVDPAKVATDCLQRADLTYHVEDCNGVFYYYNGTNWARILKPFLTYSGTDPDGSGPMPVITKGTPSGAVFSLNAVSGQENSGEGEANPLFVAGADAKIGWIVGYYSTPGNAYTNNSTYWYPAQFQLDQVNGIPADERRDFYAIDAAQTYAMSVLAGGQAGLVAQTNNKGRGVGIGNGAGATSWTRFTPTFYDTAGNPTGKTGTQFASENVTSIKYANFTTVYVLTSTFPIDTSGTSPDYNLPKSPFKHECDTSQTTHLYKLNTNDLTKWTELTQSTGFCGYALSVGTKTTDSSTLGPLGNVLWIAASNGVYKYSDAGSAGFDPQSGTTGKPYYAVTAIRDRGGAGQDLLSNWNFESHKAALVTSTTSFDSWLYYDNPWGPGPSGPVPCPWVLDGSQWVAPVNDAYRGVTGADGTAFGAVQITPSPGYNGNGSQATGGCLAGNYDPYFVNGVSQYTDPSTIEGQKFRLTGKYKVTFPAKANSSWPNSVAPQGGVVVGCAGNADNAVKSGQYGYTNCSYSNRSLMRTPDNPTNTDPGRDANGWVSFSLTFSREDQLFSSIYTSAYVSLTNRRMMLAVTCEATYGAQVTCDDVHLEELSDPPVVKRDTYLVIAAGPDVATNGIAVNEDALKTGTMFKTEAMPNKFRTDAALAASVLDDINSLYSIGAQHVFGVGRGHNSGFTPEPYVGVVLMSRTPSTLTGTIWAGGTNPTGATTSSPIGQISASCVNDKVGNQTLCQRSPDSYGLSLEINTGVNTTKQGALVGRAWFGKTPGDQSDLESIDLGKCLRAPGDLAGSEPRIDPVNQPFYLGGKCDTTTGTCLLAPGGTAHSTMRCSTNADCSRADNQVSCRGGRCAADWSKGCSTDRECNFGGVCDLDARRCWKDAGHTAHTTAVCLTNFDCFGRCERDQGFLCVRDDDCRLGQSSTLTSLGATTGNLKTNPSNRLVCGQTVNNAAASPLACSPVGWLSFNASDFSTGLTSPDGVAFRGGAFNTLFAGCNLDTSSPSYQTCRLNSAISCTTNAACPDHNSNYLAGSNMNRGAHELSGWGRFMSYAAGYCSTGPGDTSSRGKSCRSSTDCTDVAGSVCMLPANGWVHLRSTAPATTPGCGNVVAGKCDSNTTVSCTPATVATDCTIFGCRNCDGGALATGMNCAFCQDAGNRSCVPSDTSVTAACYMECEGTQEPSRGNQPYKCTGVADCVGKTGATGVCKAPGFCSGDGTTRCASDDNCPGKGTCTTGAVCSSAGSRCVPYGVHLDTESGKFYGYAWSEDLGWLDLRTISYGGNRTIQTKLGDIYATGQIGQSGLAAPSTTAQCNATYLITSGQSITGFCSTLADTAVLGGSPKQEFASIVPIISPENTFQNVLGRFDINGIETKLNTGCTSNCKNKYGSTVVTLDAANFSTELNNALSAGDPHHGSLGGRVFVATGNVTLGATTFGNTLAADTLAAVGPGSGMLIINGNLTIVGPLTYGSGLVSDLRRLASLMVVVKGNIVIDNAVQEIVGAYYVTGRFETSSGETNNQYPLVVNGLVIAKQFVFKRQFAGTVEAPTPSELIVYDGRLQSNPLPGIVDFANILPNTGTSGP